MNATRPIKGPRAGIAFILLAAVAFAAKDDTAARLDRAAALFTAASHAIPPETLRDARCVIIVPQMKNTGLVATGISGRGFAVCRRGAAWSAPAAMQISGKSVGLHAGRSARDVVILILTPAAMKRLVSNKYEVPSTSPTPEVLGYARSGDSFEDISLQRDVLSPDEETNRGLYGPEMIRATKKILTDAMKTPPPAERLAAALKGN